MNTPKTGSTANFVSTTNPHTPPRGIGAWSCTLIQDQGHGHRKEEERLNV